MTNCYTLLVYLLKLKYPFGCHLTLFNLACAFVYIWTIRKCSEMRNLVVVRAHFQNFWLGKAFFSRIWHAVVLTQFGSADSKSAPCQAIFCVFPTQNSKTKWPPKLMKMSQHYINAWPTMNIKHHFGVLKPTWATYLNSPEFHLVCLPLED